MSPEVMRGSPCSTVPLGELVALVNGRGFKKSEWSEIGIPIIRIENLHGSQRFNYYQGPFDPNILVRKGDLLISWAGALVSIDVAVWEGPQGLLNQHIFKCVPRDERVGIRYLMYAVREKLGELRTKVHGGVGLIHLTKNKLESLPMLLPSLEIQEKIVARIEELQNRISHVCSLGKEAAKESEGLIRTFLGRLLLGVPLTSTLREFLLEKPRNGWSVRCDDSENGIPVLSLSAITGFQYRPDQFKRTSQKTSPNSEYWLRSGELLISRSNTGELVGHAAIYDGTPFPCIYPDLMMRLVVDETRTSKRFVHRWLMSTPVREYIDRAARGTSSSMKKISQKAVENIPFPSGLSLDEQGQIASLMDRVEAHMASVKRLRQEILMESEHLVSSVLSRALLAED